MTLFLVGAIGALLVSALCSLAEATLLSLTPSQIAQIRQKHPRIGAIWERFKGDIDKPIAVILLVNTTAHTIGASVAGAQFGAVFDEKYLWAFSLVFTFLMLQFTEIVPKTLGVSCNRTLALVIGTPLRWSVRICSPILAVIHFINKPFMRGGHQTARTVEEIRALATMAGLEQEANPDQVRIIRTATRLTEITVAQVMIPYDQAIVLRMDEDLDAVVDAARRDGHTRYPVSRGADPQDVVGYVSMKELHALLAAGGEVELFDAVRPITRVGVEESAADLLRTFTTQHVHLALVRDGEGRYVGLVTMEDLIEELVGEREDELDALPNYLQALGGGGTRWRMGGGLRQRIAADKLGHEAAPDDESLSEWLTRKLGRSPRSGDEVALDGVVYRVGRLRRGKVYDLTVRATGSPEVVDEQTSEGA